jgi:hypothetical protein
MNKIGILLFFISCLFILPPSVTAVLSPESVTNHEIIISAMSENSKVKFFIPDATTDNEAESSAQVIDQLNAPRNQSSRITVIDSEVFRGKPVYVTRPASGLLTRTVRIWKFADNISVSTRSASEFFGRIPVQNETMGLLMSPDETNAVKGSDLTVLVEYPSSEGQFEIMYDRNTGSVSDSLTNKPVFNLKEITPSSVDNNLSTFLDVLRNDTGKDSFAIYRINIVEPYIRVDPAFSISKGSQLKITGTTNLPAGDGLEGSLHVSNLFNDYKGPSSRSHVISGDKGKNTWSWVIKTDQLPLSEYFLSVKPSDSNIDIYAFSKLFSILPENGTPINELGYQDTEGYGASLKSCNISNSLCNGTLGLALNFIGQYNRVVVTYKPDSINITNATFYRVCGATRRSPPAKTETITATFYRVNNNTVIFTPQQNLCFTDFRHISLINLRSDCRGCNYGLNIEYSYPNPAVISPKKDMYYMTGTGYLWMDKIPALQKTRTAGISQMNVSGKNPIVPDETVNAFTENRNAEERKNFPYAPVTPKASSFSFPESSMILIINFYCLQQIKKYLKKFCDNP